MNPGPKKSIFEYSNYREYLRDFYAWAKAENPRFSFRYFARLAGFNSSSVLKNVIDGKRNIAHYNIDSYAKALKLNKEETTYFRNLVLLNQASTDEEKQRYAEGILHSRLYKKIHPLNSSQYNFYAHWYISIIWELTGLPGFKEDPEWISKKLKPTITSKEAKKAIEELLRLGLLVRDPKGTLTKATSNLATLDEVTFVAVAQWHREMIMRGRESIGRTSRENRDISSVTFPISEKMLKSIKEKIQEFRRQIVEMQKIDSGGPDAIYQLNMQLFPHVRMTDEEDN